MLYIGIDVGGTNLKAGLVDETGKILAVERCPLNFQGPEQFAEEVARLALLTVQIDPHAAPVPQCLLDKHYTRKHGPNAYYGQEESHAGTGI